MGRTGAIVLLGVLCAATLGVGWWTKARCLTDGAWHDGEQYTSWCYTDVYPLYFAERLHERALPYRDHPVEYPVLTGAQQWAAAEAVRVLPEPQRPVAFYHLTALVGGLLLLATFALLAREGLPPGRLAWFAAAPTLAVYAFMNWDAVPVALFVAGLVAHRCGRDGLAGLAVGLGTAAKLYPGLLVPLVVATRLAQRRPRDALAHAGAAAGAWAAVNLPVWLAWPDGWQEFFRLNRLRPADWDSLWFLAEQVRGQAFALATVNRWSALAFVGGALVIAVVGARRRPAQLWWQLALPLLAWFLLSNKVYSPQFSLWLLPLLVVALPRVEPLAAFLAADLAVFLVRFPYLGGLLGHEPAPAYPLFGVTVAVRAAVLLGIVVLVTWQPAGGVLGRRRLLGG